MHQIILKRNDFANVIMKSTAQSFKVDIMPLSWILPVLHPSLPIATQLDTELIKKPEQL